MASHTKGIRMQALSKEQELIYQQGVANLKLEGMSLTSEQDRIARNYQSGQLTRAELIKEALEYARTR